MPKRLYVNILFIVLLLISTFHLKAQQPVIDSLKKIYKAHRNDTLGANAAVELCYELRFIKQDSALYYGNDAVAIARSLGYEKGVAQALSDVGTIYYDKGDLKMAETLWLSSLDIRTKRNDILKMASSHVGLGALYYKLGDLEKSLAHQLSALSLYEQQKFDAGVARALNNVAAVYEAQNQLDMALQYFKRSSDLKYKMGDLSQVAQTQVNIGNIYYRQKDYAKAKTEWLRANKFLQRENKYVDVLAITYNNLSELYRTLGDYDSALLMTDRALTIRESKNDYSGVVSSLNSKGAILSKMKRYDEGEKFLRLALDSATARKLEPERQKIYMNLYDLFDARGDAKAALENYKLSTQVKDSIFNERSRRNINELQIKFESEQKERQIVEQKALVVANELRIVILASALVLLVILGFLVYQWQRAKRKKLEQEAEYKLKLAEARVETELREDRLRISRELHDNIGSRLLFLSTATSTAAGNESVQELGTFAKNTLHELRRTVWLINHDSVTLEEMEMKLVEYFSFLKQSSPVDISISVEGDSSRLLRSPKAAAVFRVCQEAVSNAIKHSEATAIRILLRLLVDELTLSIADNGHGFDTVKSSAGNGLRNMQAHAAHVGGKVLASSSDTGTTIAFELLI